MGRTSSSTSSDKRVSVQARQLTRAIMGADNWQQLQQLYEQRWPDMNLIHVSAVMTRLTLLQHHHQHHQQQAHQQVTSFIDKLDQHVCQLLSAVQLPQASAVEVLRAGASGTRLLLLQAGAQPTPQQHAPRDASSRQMEAARLQQPVMPQQLANLVRVSAG